MPPAGYPAFLQYLQSGRVRNTRDGAWSRVSIGPPQKTHQPLLRSSPELGSCCMAQSLDFTFRTRGRQIGSSGIPDECFNSQSPGSLNDDGPDAGLGVSARRFREDGGVGVCVPNGKASLEYRQEDGFPVGGAAPADNSTVSPVPATSPLNWISSAVSDFVLALLPLPTLTLMVSQCTDVTITGGGGEGGGGVGRLTLVVAWAVKGIAWLRPTWSVAMP